MKITRFTLLFILLAASICWTGCEMFASHTDPLVGFHMSGAANLDANKAITDDYKDYIQKLSTEEKKYMGPILYYEDGQGRHAVTFEVNKHGSWDHYLFYDKNNKRIKTKKYYRGSYWNS